VNVNVRQRGKTDKDWELRVWLGRDAAGRDRWRTRAFHGGKREAKKAANLFLADCQAAAQASGGMPSKPGTFGELVERWFATMAPDWSPGTVVEHRRIVDTKLAPLASVKLDKITTPSLDAFYGDLRATGGAKGGALSKATVRRTHAVVHSALEQAVAWSLLPYNPATRALKGKKSVPKPANRVPSASNIQALLTRVWEADPNLATLLTLDAHCGGRRSEMLALRWTDFDRDGQTLTISRGIVRGPDGLVEKPTTKDGNGARVLPLMPETVALLVIHRKRCVERSLSVGVALASDAYIFPAAKAFDGLTPEWPSSASRRLRVACEELGVGRVTLQELRRFVAKHHAPPRSRRSHRTSDVGARGLNRPGFDGGSFGWFSSVGSSGRGLPGA
jgi:integrase